MYETTPSGAIEDNGTLAAEIQPLNKYSGELHYDHQQTQDLVDRFIEEGRLPEAYRLPDLGLFADKAAALSETYDAFHHKGWAPVAVFVPLGLTVGQWNTLLSGHRIEDGAATTTGFSREWQDESDLVGPAVDPSSPLGLWDLAIISTLDEPVIEEVSPDGHEGFDAVIASSELSGLPSVVGLSDIVKQFSPALETYLAFQLGNIDSDSVVDTGESSTIGKERFDFGSEAFSTCFTWDDQNNRVLATVILASESYWNVGVRPSARANDLMTNMELFL